MPPVKTVDQYIRAAPAEARPLLREMRATIRGAAPEARETISYGMPFYSYPGESGVERRLCYFGAGRDGISLYFRPGDLAPHADLVAPYRSAGSSLRFRFDQPIPLRLVERLVRGAWQRHRGRA